MTNATEPPTPATIGRFPPETIAAFLAFCAGDWLSLRSRFSLEEAAGEARQAEEEEVSWHSSERGDLQVTYLTPEDIEGPGGLEITPPSGGRHRLLFHPDGGFEGQAPDGAVSTGRWQLWPDGSLELTSARAGISVRERIWFTKANLRLRSSVEHHPDGRPGRASFSSEIRRLSRPAG
ncbi:MULTISPECIES: phycobiliprotein lyase [unclassified Cyanobium]|uniref:phycobiliprotein lyase n=1 Tax=unclassified Cyanobium TaxID=2627006 RepID=UPI0020CF0776|nr:MULTISPECIES: phycobiliprotein lyase [unclassified Cyanobium]MCP9857665.1 phycobiliprotein lyase [Cyanobium sp. Cruz-8H5]MCP9864762.1 phycobiliprotein lyase [Cyanobium sp. Cruz-8D1]